VIELPKNKEKDEGLELNDGVKRIKTGVPGLDDLLEGGFPHPSTILVTGNSGTGKTIFGLQYLYNGVKKYDQPGIYLTIQAQGTDVTWYASRFNLDIHSLQEERKMIISRYEVSEYEKFNSKTVAREIEKKLSRIISSIGAKRIVIDSISPFGYFSSSKANYGKLVHRLSKSLKEEDCSALFISEKPYNSELTPFEVEPYLLDGVISLSRKEKRGNRKRTLHIHKMTATRSPLEDITFNLSEDGFKLLPSYYG